MNNTARLNQRITRQYPGLFVFLLDQSGSMSEKVEGTGFKFVNTFNPNASHNLNATHYTKADIATAAINTILYEMVQAAGIDSFANVRKKSAYVTVIGYNTNVYPLVSRSPAASNPVEAYAAIDLPTLWQKPLGTVSLKRVVRAPVGMISKTENRPYWVKPFANGQTQMALALKQARKVAEQWLNSPPEYIPELEMKQRPRQECFPPVIINITDAQPNGEGNPVDVAKELQQADIGGEGMLIFNCHFTRHVGQSIILPSSIKEFQHLDTGTQNLASMMFEMSSPIPDVLRKDVDQLLKKPFTTPETRCYVYNADPDLLINFLRWGTGEMRLGSDVGGEE